MKDLGLLGWIAFIFVLVGGIDSGLYGMLSFHLLEVILGTKFLGRLAFILIGISAVYLIYLTTRKKKTDAITP